MSLGRDMQQNIQTELNFSSTPAGEAREAGREETELLPTTKDPESPARTNRLMEEVCERENLKEALRRVKANRLCFRREWNLWTTPKIRPRKGPACAPQSLGGVTGPQNDDDLFLIQHPSS